MGTNNDCSLSFENLNISTQSCFTSVGSDEGDSFVVLWKDGDKRPIQETNQEHKSFKTENELCLDGSSDGTADRDTQITQSTVLLPETELVDNSGVISIVTLSKDATSEEVQKKVSEVVEENTRLKDRILENNKIMKLQYNRILAWQEDVQKVHEAHKEKIIETKEFIEKLKKENYSLTHQLEKLQANNFNQEKEMCSLKQIAEEKNQESLNMYENKLEEANKKLGELQSIIENLTAENNALKKETDSNSDEGKIKDYEKEVDRLQIEVLAGNAQVEEAKLELKKMQFVHEEKIRFLNDTINSLRSQLLFSRQQTLSASPKEVEEIQMRLAAARTALTEAERNKESSYSQIESLNDEMFKLKMKLDETQSQTDEIFALKAQLELFKADFETEKSAKETFKMEKEKFLEDLKKLQERNQKLHEKLNTLRDNYYFVPRAQGNSGTAPSAPPPPSPDDCFLQ